ncbi:hypothetical protein CYMTET_48152 [Cymbomonas tetramitiformis]|uniref:Uncharacterized protein n=1 Tax=Cymbomonas tetramitiformis TaxID=36881 RepID=A0AAE0BUF2_9CHLO|nr:hypothetical protein CYMTET_48152 [Cymbomonas tetramitiformis]
MDKKTSSEQANKEYEQWMQIIRYPEKYTLQPDPRKNIQIIKIAGVSFYTAHIGTSYEWNEYKKIQQTLKTQKTSDLLSDAVVSYAYRYVNDEHLHMKLVQKYDNKLFQSFIMINDLKRGNSHPKLPLNISDCVYAQYFKSMKNKKKKNLPREFDNFPPAACTPTICVRYFYSRFEPKFFRSLTSIDHTDGQNSNIAKKRQLQSKLCHSKIYEGKKQKTEAPSTQCRLHFPLCDVNLETNDTQGQDSAFQTYFDQHVQSSINELTENYENKQIYIPDVYDTNNSGLYEPVSLTKMTPDTLRKINSVIFDNKDNIKKSTEVSEMSSMDSENGVSLTQAPDLHTQADTVKKEIRKIAQKCAQEMCALFMHQLKDINARLIAVETDT